MKTDAPLKDYERCMLAVESALSLSDEHITPMAQELCNHLLNLGGKRVRARMVLLATGACGYACQQGEALATIVEWLHTATLLHDDVIDHAEYRRHAECAQAIWGNAASILGGDFLYAQAFKRIAKLQHHETTATLAQATADIVEGEIKQLSRRYELYLDEAIYFDLIGGKTARLFEVSAALPAIYLNAEKSYVEALKQFGYHYGLAYQVLDDALDYSQNTTTLGKKQYQDLKDGTCTLPLILAAKQASESEREQVTAALKGNVEAQSMTTKLVSTRHGVQQSIAIANNFCQIAESALRTLPKSAYVDALLQLLHQVLKRTF